MKTVNVVAAIIKDQNKIFSTQRGYGEFINMWEFPGGKIEEGETKEEALIREIKEELEVSISVDSFLTTVEYDYPNFHLTMHCYLCTILDGTINLVEHSDAKWLDLKHIDTVNWLPADIAVVDKLKEIHAL